MKFVRLRSPADGSPDGSGSDNTSSAVMEAWGGGEGVLDNGTGQPSPAPAAPTPPPAPAPRQVTPPPRPARQIIQDNTPANQGVEEPTPAAPVTPTPPAQQPTPAAPPTAGLTEADLARIATVAAGAARQAVPQQQPQQPPAQERMSDAELDARYKRPVVTAETMQAIMSDPAKGAAVFNQLLRQAETAALMMSYDLHQAELARVRGEVQPHLQAFQTFQAQRSAAEQRARFSSAHPDIASESELIDDVRDALEAKINRGELPKFASEADAFKAVADGVRKIVARMGGTIPANGGQPPPTHTAPTQRRPAVATQQGRGNTGPVQQKSGMESVMDSWN